MSGVTVGGVTTSYLYNDAGIRVRSTTGSSTNLYLVDANNHTGYAQVLEELSVVGGTPTRSYVIGDDVLAQAASTASYLLYDGHGSTRQLVNNTASVTSRYNYDAYGIMLDSSSASPETSLRYCGEQFDTTLNMYNLRARYYDQNTGRFNQRDTFAGSRFDPQSLHKYGYGHSDPINSRDPSGRMTVVEVVVVIAIIAVLAAILIPAVNRASLRGKQTQMMSELRNLVNNPVDDRASYEGPPTPFDVDVGDPQGVRGGGPPGFTPSNAGELTIPAYGFPDSPDYFGEEWEAYVRTPGGKQPILVFNGNSNKDASKRPLVPDSVNYLAGFVQEDARFGIGRPFTRNRWYCAWAGSEVKHLFKSDTFYKLPIDVEAIWFQDPNQNNQWFEGFYPKLTGVPEVITERQYYNAD
jgi:RHS repeat-associated protein